MPRASMYVCTFIYKYAVASALSGVETEKTSEKSSFGDFWCLQRYES